MQREKIVPGLVLIGLGLWFLLVNMGLLTWEALGQMVRFWPLILVVIGLDLMVRRTRWWFLTVFLVVAGFAALLGFSLTGGFPGTRSFSWHPEGNTFRPWRYFERRGPTSTRQLSHPVPAEARSGRVKLSFGAAEVKVQGGTSALYELDSTTNLPEPPVARYSLEGDVAAVRIWQPGLDRLVGGVISEWDVRLTERLPLSVEINGGASDLEMDFSQVMIRDLEVHVGASDLGVRLGNREPEVRVGISAGASSIRLEVPRGAGIKVESKGVFTGNNLIEQGLLRQDGFYATAGFDKAPVRIMVTFASAAGDLNLDFY